MGVHQMCQNNNHLHFASHWIIWWFSFSCSFVFRSCKTLARQTRLRMRSSRNIYKILTLSKSMPPDSTRISITTSDVSEVSKKFSKTVLYPSIRKCCHAQTLSETKSDQIPWHFGVKNQHFGQNHDCSKSQSWFTSYNPVSDLISDLTCSNWAKFTSENLTFWQF